MISNNSDRILIVSPSLKSGGIEKALTVLANGFNKKGFKVTFLSCLPGIQHFLLDDEINVIKSNISYKSIFQKPLFYIRILFFIRSHTIRVKPNELHGGRTSDKGGAFVSIQHWLNGIEPSNVGLNWDGKTMGNIHSDHLNKTNNSKENNGDI